MAKTERIRAEVKQSENLRPEQLAFLLWHLIYQWSNDDSRQATVYLLESGARGVDGLAIVPAGVEKYLATYLTGGVSGVRKESAQIGEMLAQRTQTGLSCRVAEAELTGEAIMAVKTADLVGRVAQLGTKVDALVTQIEREHSVVKPQTVRQVGREATRDADKRVKPLDVREIAAYLGVAQEQITVQNILGGKRPGVLEVGCVRCVPVQARPTTEFGRDEEILAAAQQEQSQSGLESETNLLPFFGVLGGLFSGAMLLDTVAFALAPAMFIDPLLIYIDEDKLGKLPVGAGPMIDVLNELSRVMVKTAVGLLSFAEVAAAFDAALKDRPVSVREQWDRTQRMRVQSGLSTLAEIATVMRQAYDQLMDYQHALWQQLELRRKETGKVPDNYGLLLPAEAAVLGRLIEAMFTGLTGKDGSVKVAGNDDALIRRMQAGVI